MTESRFFALIFSSIVVLAFLIFFNQDLQGVVSIIILFLFTVLLTKKNPLITNLLFVALVVRIFIVFLSLNLNLPDNVDDATIFENKAWYFAQGGFFNLVNHNPWADTYFLSWLIAIPYSLFGRSMIMAQSISLFFAISTIFLGCKFAKKIWGDSVAVKVGWVMALFPSLILYSGLILREAYINFFLLLACAISDFDITDWG